MKIIDAFLFNGEWDLFKLRHVVLNNKVNRFFAVESFKSFANTPKIQEELLHYSFDTKQYPYTISMTTNVSYTDRWANERYLRNQLLEALRYTKSDDDIVLISDVDEIPDPAYLPLIIDKVQMYGVCTCYMRNFYYYLNAIQDSGGYLWPGTIAVSVKLLKEHPPQYWRERREHFSLNASIVNGWHLSFMGGKDSIKRKISHFSHSEYDNDDFKNDKHLDKVLKVHGNKFIDLFNRGNSYTLLDIPDALRILPRPVSKRYHEFEHLFYKGE